MRGRSQWPNDMAWSAGTFPASVECTPERRPIPNEVMSRNLHTVLCGDLVARLRPRGHDEEIFN